MRKVVNEEDLLNLGGVYGDKRAGDPFEYDHLKLILNEDMVEIEVFNSEITLFPSDDRLVRRNHRFLCKLDKAEKDWWRGGKSNAGKIVWRGGVVAVQPRIRLMRRGVMKRVVHGAPEYNPLTNPV